MPGFADLNTAHYANINFSRKGKVSYFKHQQSKVNFARYADDFIVTAASEEIAQEAKEIIRAFLKTRGLELSEEKTLITHIDDGFDMLGWTFRKFKGKLIVKPSKKSIKSFVASLSKTVLRHRRMWKQDVLIERLNQQICGWANYYQSVCANATFSYIDNALFWILWRWAKRRHPHNSKGWRVARYWHRKDNQNWVFCTENRELLLMGKTPIVRHPKVRMDAIPYFDTQYFIDRKFNLG